MCFLRCSKHGLRLSRLTTFQAMRSIKGWGLFRLLSRLKKRLNIIYIEFLAPRAIPSWTSFNTCAIYLAKSTRSCRDGGAFYQFAWDTCCPDMAGCPRIYAEAHRPKWLTHHLVLRCCRSIAGGAQWRVISRQSAALPEANHTLVRMQGKLWVLCPAFALCTVTLCTIEDYENPPHHAARWQSPALD